MMKRFVFAAAVAAFAVPAHAADVGVSVSIGQPGFYGRIDIGNHPPPQVVYAEPVIIQPAPVAVVRRPIYLHVPPGHAKNWSKHCYRYEACGQPVYFVQERWYNDVYVPRYHRANAPRYRDGRHEGYRDGYRDGRRADRRDDYRDGYRDGRRDEHRGNDRRSNHDDRDRGGKHGHGQGNGKGRG